MAHRNWPRCAATLVVLLVAALSAGASASQALESATAWDPADGLLISGATVVTMNHEHSVIPHGRVLVRDGRIAAVWLGADAARRRRFVGDARVIEAGLQDLLFPGLINLHSHPRENQLHTWPSPSSHALPAQGKGRRRPVCEPLSVGRNGESHRSAGALAPDHERGRRAGR